MAQLGNTVVNGNLRVMEDVYGTDRLTGFESTTTGNTLTFVGVPDNCLVRFRMMNSSPTFADNYLLIQGGRIVAEKPIGTDVITDDIYDSSTQTLTIIVNMASSPNRYYRLDIVSTFKQ